METNKRHHIFGDLRHNLEPLVRHFGDDAAAAEALEKAVLLAYRRGELVARNDGRYRQVFDVAGHWVTVDGRVVDHIPRISTAWISGEGSGA